MAEPIAPVPETAPGTVYDKVFARVVQVDPTDPVVQANPARFEKVGAQDVYMLAPNAEGQMVPMTVPANQAQAALDAGWAFEDQKAASREVAVNYHMRQFDSDAAVAGQNFASSVLFGVPEILEQHSMHEDLREAKARTQEKHAIAGALGTAAGALTGGLLAPGLGVAKSAGTAAGLAAAEGAAPGLASRVLGAAGRSALEGAAFSAPQAVAQLAVGDYDKAAESVLWGLGTGGLLGLTGAGFAEASRAAKGKLAGVAESLAVKSAEREASAASDLGKAYTEHSAILDKAIAGGGKEAKALGVLPTDLASKVQTSILETRPGLAGKALTGAEAEMRTAATDVVKAIGHGDKRLSFGELDALRTKFAAGAADTAQGAVMRQAEQLVAAEQQKAMAAAYGALPLKADYARYLSTLEGANTPAAAQWAGKKMAQSATNAIAGATGGALGAVLGGPVGAFVGQRAVNPLVEKVLGQAIERHGTAIASKALGKIAADPRTEKWFGASLAKSLVGSAESRTKEAVKALSTAGTGKTRAADDVLAGYLGKGATGLSKPQQWARVVQSLISTQANPAQFADEHAAAAEVFGHDPQLMQAVQARQQAAVGYLQGVASKAMGPATALPFRDPSKPGELSAAQKAPIARALEVVDDPMSVMGHVREGTLTKDHVEAMQALYPQQHAQLVAEVQAMAHNPELAAKIPLGVRQQLGKLTGINIANPKGINYQASYRGPQAQGQGHGQKGVPKPKAAARPTIEYPKLETTSERIANK